MSPGQPSGREAVMTSKTWSEKPPMLRISAAGRTLFAASRRQKKSTNDADRLRKYLAHYELGWQTLRNQ
jgi:hypothetical protein